MSNWNQSTTLRHLIILGLHRIGLEYNFIITAIIHFACLTENYMYTCWKDHGEIDVTTLHPTQIQLRRNPNYGVIFQTKSRTMLYFGIGGNKQYLSTMEKWIPLETSRTTIGEVLEDFGFRYDQIVGSVVVAIQDSKLTVTVGMNSELLSVYLDRINPSPNNQKLLAGQIGCATWIKILSS